MPHAALWVVQPAFSLVSQASGCCFNAARGFVGGATHSEIMNSMGAGGSFNAARGFVGGATIDVEHKERERQMFQCRTRLCGWCNRIARSPCPPKGKKPFWKVSGNLSVLTENM